MLEQFKGQFFQWFYIDGFALPKVKDLFDELFAHLAQTTGEQNQASYKQWRGRHRFWNKSWRMPKKVKGSAPAAFPPQLERCQLWRLGIDEDLAVGSTVASVNNRNSPSVSNSEDHDKQKHSAGQRQIIGMKDSKSDRTPTPVFTTAPDFDRSFKERTETSWTTLYPSSKISKSSDLFNGQQEDGSSSFLSQCDLPFHSTGFPSPQITDTSVYYSSLDFRNLPGWTNQDCTARSGVPGLTFHETEETPKSRLDSREGTQDSFVQFSPRNCEPKF
ncbi:hypothetical protein MMC07_001708 [Pseudocyphellaria aurata]|nr:hypothetical protein [Pseudocyphellaria aurata]